MKIEEIKLPHLACETPFGCVGTLDFREISVSKGKNGIIFIDTKDDTIELSSRQTQLLIEKLQEALK